MIRYDTNGMATHRQTVPSSGGLSASELVEPPCRGLGNIFEIVTLSGYLPQKLKHFYTSNSEFGMHEETDRVELLTRHSTQFASLIQPRLDPSHCSVGFTLHGTCQRSRTVRALRVRKSALINPSTSPSNFGVTFTN